MLKSVTSQMPKYMPEVIVEGTTKELCKIIHQDKCNVNTVMN